MTTKEADYTIAARPITVMRKQMNDKPYEASALDLSILRVALRAHLERVRKVSPEVQLATEDLIEKIDNCDGLFIQVSI